MKAITVNRFCGANRSPGGFALLMVLMLIATASVVGISYIYGSQVKTASTGNLMLASEARYLAESGLQHGLYSLQNEATSFGSAGAPNGPYHIDARDGGYDFYIAETSTPNDYKITASGSSDTISQTLSMTVRLTSQYAAKMEGINPSHWWRLGDSGLTAVDTQGRSDGLYVNGVTRDADGALLGDIDTAASFGGSNDYVNISSMDSLSQPKITLGCWVRADSWASSYPRIMSRATGAEWYDRRWEIAVSNTRKLRFTLRLNNTVYELHGSTVFQLGQWYFIVATYDKDAKQMKIYVNGELDGTKFNTAYEDVKDDSGVQAWIGDCPNSAGQRPWSGPIDEVFIVKGKALGAARIKTLYDLRVPNVEVISWDD